MTWFYRLFLVFMIFVVNLCASDFTDVIKNFKPTQDELEAGAVVLRYDTKIYVDAKYKIRRDEYVLIAILGNEAAHDYAQIDLKYNSYYKDMKLVYARVIRSDGTFSKLKKDALKISSSKDYYQYDNTKSINFSLPDIQEGNFIEFKISTTTKKELIKNQVAFGHYMLFQQLNTSKKKVRFDKVRDSSLSVKVDKSIEMSYYSKTLKVKKRSDLHNNIYEIKVSNLKKLKIENNVLKSIDELIPNITFSTYKSWNVIYNAFFKSYQKASVPVGEIKKITKKITSKCDNDMQKVKEIYAYVNKNIKYIFAFVGKSGYVPHSAGEIYKNKYGDCKDQATIFISMLRSVGIDAYPAFVNTQNIFFGEKTLPRANLFNHVITYIPKFDLWVDTTGGYAKFPGISWSINNTNSYIMNAKGGFIKRVNVKRADTIFADISVQKEDEKIDIKLNISFDDYSSDIYKSLLLSSQNFSDEFENIFKKFYRYAEMDSFSIKNKKNPFENIKISAHMKIDNVQDEIVLSSQLYAIVSLIVPFELTSPKKRIHGFKLAYPFKIKLKTTFRYDKAGYFVKFEKYPSEFKSKFYEYSFEGDEKESLFVASEEFVLKKNKIKKDEYAEFYKQITHIPRDLSWMFRFVQDSSKAQEIRLSENIKNGGNIEDRVKLIELHIDDGDYEKAKSEIETLLKTEGKSAKLYYLYGLVLGYMDEFDESDKAFEKAKNLGYKEY